MTRPLDVLRAEWHRERDRAIERALWIFDGNRTHAARALDMQRTYLLRIIRRRRLKARLHE